MFRLQIIYRLPSRLQMMVDCAKNPLVVPFCGIGGRLVEIQGLGIGLENCQKSLNEYLDSKRRIFPRFYFISTDELLSILGSSEASAVQNHIIKVGTTTTTTTTTTYIYTTPTWGAWWEWQQQIC